jgi:hypothetical protein
VLLSAALAVAISAVPRPPAQAQATVRINRSVRVTREAWRQDRPAKRREIRVLEDGRTVTIRVIEFE